MCLPVPEAGNMVTNKMCVLPQYPSMPNLKSKKVISFSKYLYCLSRKNNKSHENKNMLYEDTMLAFSKCYEGHDTVLQSASPPSE